MLFSKRGKSLIDFTLFEDSNKEVSYQKSKELHVFDFDETLAYTPDGVWELYLGYYLEKDKFEAAEPGIVDAAIPIINQAGIKTLDVIDEPRSPWGPTKVLALNHENYELARKIINKEFRNNIFATTLPTKLKYGKFKQPLSIYYVFPDSSDFPVKMYERLPALNILQNKLLSGYPVYICTARKGAANVLNIKDFLKKEKIELPTSNIFAVGENNKGLTVKDLIFKHDPNEVYFYDDSTKNCQNVIDMCCDLVRNLFVTQYSRSNPGTIKNVTECGTNKKQNVNEKRDRFNNESRKTFRKWRKLSRC